MGYGHGRTAASTAKGNESKYEGERCSLVGDDSLLVWSFVLFAASAVKKYTGTFDVALLFARMGLPPGCRLPHGRSGVSDLNRHLAARVRLTGSDVRISTGQITIAKT